MYSKDRIPKQPLVFLIIIGFFMRIFLIKFILNEKKSTFSYFCSVFCVIQCSLQCFLSYLVLPLPASVRKFSDRTKASYIFPTGACAVYNLASTHLQSPYKTSKVNLNKL